MAASIKSHVIFNLKRNILKRQCLSQKLYSSVVEATSVERRKEPEIVIPYRIQRGPTDILKALSTTLKKDFTAPQYKYEDDPYFIPAGNVSKRSFALSKESGKQAARYFLEKYPELFQFHISDPPIKAFDPPIIYTENNEVTEEILQRCVTSFDVRNALTVYQSLTQKGVKLNQETKQMLLELLSFYNCEIPPLEDYYEERWFARKEDRPHATWKRQGIAEQLFNDMEQDAAAYCTMIQGAAKYNDSHRVEELYKDLCEKCLPATLETYNGLLSLVCYVKEDGDMRWQYAMDMVGLMNRNGISPDIYTMNALMAIPARTRRWRNSQEVAVQLLAEMRRLKIEPSLGTYSHVLTVFCQNVRGFSSVLSQVINELQGKEYEIRHPDDTTFFVKAMDICNREAYDKDVAYEIYALLETGNNCSLIGSAFAESIFFKNFFKLLCETEDFEKFIDLYEKLVPNTYTPEPSVMLSVLNALTLNEAYQHLPKICSDVILFEQTEREDVLTELVKVIGGRKHNETEQGILINMVWSIIENLDRRAQDQRRRSIEWTGFLIADMWKTFLNGNDLEKSWAIMQRIKEKETSIIGYPDEDCFLKFCEVFLKAKEFQKVEYCLRFANEACSLDLRPTVSKMAQKMLEENILQDHDRSAVTALSGSIKEQLDEKVT